MPLESHDPAGRTEQESSHLGSMIMIEDISDEKRMKSTMSRYIDPGIADQLMSDGTDIMGGQETVATVLFSDVRPNSTYFGPKLHPNAVLGFESRSLLLIFLSVYIF